MSFDPKVDTVQVMYDEKIKSDDILGTRPEIIRLSQVIPLFDKFCDHTSSHRQNFDFELGRFSMTLS